MPFHLRETLDQGLRHLECQRIISPLQYARQISPVVWVRKPNGQYRMCVDFKATINANIQSGAYPMPTVEETFGKIGKASHFAKLNLKSAYWQIVLDEKAKQLSIINTHKGLFSVNRSQMGMKNASVIFQRCMENILKGIQGVIVYQDDVMLCADSGGQLKRRLKLRLKEHAVILHDKKVH